MKKAIVILIFSAALLGSSASYGQKPVEQKPVQSGAGVQSAPREGRSEDRREELSKKLLQRKNELRKEDHVQAKERRNTDIQQKSPDVKKN